MVDIPKECAISLSIKDAIEKTIINRMRMNVKYFRIFDYDKLQLQHIIDLANEEYTKNPNRMIPKILWEDFYHWYTDYHG